MASCNGKEVKNPFAEYPDDLVIKMVATNRYMVFYDGIDSFDRSYSLAWDSVNVYGRQDAIQTYQSTGETISLSWPLKPGTDPDVFNYQLEALLALGKFVRPLYGKQNDTERIIEAPLLLIKYRNLIVEEYSGGTGTELLIAPSSLSVNYGDRAREVSTTQGNLLVPKRILISLSGVVINQSKKYYDVPVEFTPPPDSDTDQARSQSKKATGSK
jgi:hypothetical protein